jgi:hypothetical protein
LYESETWYFSLRDEHALRVFESRMLKKIFGPKREEITGDWRKLKDGEVRDMESPQVVIWVIMLDEGEMSGVCVMQWGAREMHTEFCMGNLKE